MPAQLTLVCHAATSATRAAAFPGDEPAETASLRQAAALRARLGRVTRAWTSPAQRARQTAAALGLQAEAAPALRDCDFGRWAGRTLAEVERDEPAALAVWLSDAAQAPHGGEPLAGVAARIAAWMQETARDGRVVAVTHPAVIRAAIVHALGAPPASLWRIDVEPLSLTRLHHGSGGWSLRQRGPRG